MGVRHTPISVIHPTLTPIRYLVIVYLHNMLRVKLTYLSESIAPRCMRREWRWYDMGIE
jgi:hypothetical protein